MNRKYVGKTLMLALLLSGSIHAEAARQANITKDFNDVPLKEVLNEVENELQYSVIYKKGEVNEAKLINQRFENATLEEVLSAVLDKGLLQNRREDDCHHPGAAGFGREGCGDAAEPEDRLGCGSRRARRAGHRSQCLGEGYQQRYDYRHGRTLHVAGR